MVYSVLSDDISTVSQFTRKKKITITTGGTSTPANYQVKLTITYESEMQTDFEDIRFNTIAGGYIDYWIESYTASTTATVWVELSDAITDPGSDVILMYYGNPGLSDGGVGNDTFIQYHGSASANFVDSYSVTPTNIIFEADARITSATHNIKWGLKNTSGVDVTDDVVVIASYSVTNEHFFIVYNEGTYTYVTEIPDADLNVWERLKIVMTGATWHGYVDGNEVSTGISANLPDESLGLTMFFDSGTGEQNWSFVRKYIANEPTPSYGTAQHQRRVCTII